MCYKLELVKKGLDNSFEYIDVQSFLSIGGIETAVTAQGKMKVTTFMQDWKEHEKGFKFPSKITQEMGPMTMEVNFTDLKVNPKIDSKMFDPPS